MKDFDQLLATEQYAFLQSKGLKAFRCEEKPSWGNTTYEAIHIAPSAQQLVGNGHQIVTISEIAPDKYKHRHVSNKNHPKLQEEFIIDFFCKHDKLQKEALKHFTFRMHDNHSILFRKINQYGRDAIGTILTFPVSIWELQHVPLVDIDNFIESKNYGDEEVFNFWHRFIKARKAQFQSRTNAQKISEFLIDKYEHQHERLKEFFEFSPYLRGKFEKVKLDIYEEDCNFITSLVINCKSIEKLLQLSAWNTKRYEELCMQLAQAIGKHYGASCEVYLHNTRRRTLRACFFHNEDNLTKAIVSEHLDNFFNYLKTNPDFDTSAQNLATWVSHDVLCRLTQDKDGMVTKKVKKL